MRKTKLPRKSGVSGKFRTPGKVRVSGNRRIPSSKESEAYPGKVSIPGNGKGTWEREYYQGKLRTLRGYLGKLITRRKVKDTEEH